MQDHKQAFYDVIALRLLDSASKTVQFTAIALRWLAVPQFLEMRHRFALFCHFLPQLSACVCLSVKRLRNRCGTSHFAECQDLHLKIAAVVLYV